MKKIICVIQVVLIFFISGCAEKNSEEKITYQEPESTAEQYEIINGDGDSLETRFRPPEGFVRNEAEEGSLLSFLRNYKMKEHNSAVCLYDGRRKINQNAHAAVFDMDMTEGDLQQCADSVMRIYAEYYLNTGRESEISFHYTDGSVCRYTDYNDFDKYLRMVFSYAGTLSMYTYETEPVSVSELGVGDVVIKGGSPGHVVMIVDECENQRGEKAFLLAQGYMPAQEFHVLKNPAHGDNPWYYESEFTFPFETPEFTFTDEDMLRRLKY